MPEITIHRHIAHSEQGLYLLVPFEMPANTARIDVCYSYPSTRVSSPFRGSLLFKSGLIPSILGDRAGWLQVGASGRAARKSWSRN